MCSRSGRTRCSCDNPLLTPQEVATICHAGKHRCEPGHVPERAYGRHVHHVRRPPQRRRRRTPGQLLVEFDPPGHRHQGQIHSMPGPTTRTPRCGITAVPGHRGQLPGHSADQQRAECHPESGPVTGGGSRASPTGAPVCRSALPGGNDADLRTVEHLAPGGVTPAALAYLTVPSTYGIERHGIHRRRFGDGRPRQVRHQAPDRRRRD